MKKIRINAKTIIAFQNGTHKILNDGCLVLEGNKILFVGKDYQGETDEVLDCTDKIVCPGFINVHTHISGSPLDKTFQEDYGNRQFYFGGLADIIPAIISVTDDQARAAAADSSMVEMIRTGTTTFMEMGPFGEYIQQKTLDVGLRAYISNWFQGATWVAHEGRYLEYYWREEQAIQEFKDSVEFMKRIEGTGNGRIKGFISPLHTDTSTERLLRMCKEASDYYQVPLALHVSQSIMEFQELVKRTKMTPVEWLNSIGFLNDWNILGHVMYIAGSTWTNFVGDDLSILGANGVSIAHCPWVMAKKGHTLEYFSKYQDAGINMCLGTDTIPLSMIESIRYATILGKVMSRNAKRPMAYETFNAATVNAAKVLHRDDIGRISAGALADLLFWDANSIFMVPNRDPIKAIVYNASPLDLSDVMVDGKWIMKDRRLLTMNEQEVARSIQKNAERVWSNLGRGDIGAEQVWSNKGAADVNTKTVNDYAPLSFPEFEN